MKAHLGFVNDGEQGAGLLYEQQRACRGMGLNACDDLARKPYKT